MKRTVLVIFLVAFFSLNLFGQKLSLKGFTGEEYKFFSETRNDSADSFTVILNETIPANIFRGKAKYSISGDGRVSVRYLRKFIPELSDELVKDFNLRNNKSYRLERKFTLAGKYVLISGDDLSKIFSESGDLFENWNNFKKKYPDAFGYNQFSRIGFNKAKTHALIYSTYFCGSLCAEGYYIFYIKENDKWIEKEKIALWFS